MTMEEVFVLLCHLYISMLIYMCLTDILNYDSVNIFGNWHVLFNYEDPGSGNLVYLC